MPKIMLVRRVANPSGPPAKQKRLVHLIGEEKEMAYARRQITVLGKGGDVLTSMHKIRKIVQHALHNGFRMGRGKR